MSVPEKSALDILQEYVARITNMCTSTHTATDVPMLLLMKIEVSGLKEDSNLLVETLFRESLSNKKVELLSSQLLQSCKVLENEIRDRLEILDVPSNRVFVQVH